MHREFLMGNEAMAAGALAAGVNVVAGYPGTPSTEVLEAVARRRAEGVYVEWSVNEKAALEVAAGAAYAGARALVTMKQVGLNVASDPLMSLSYIGVKGGMVVTSEGDTMWQCSNCGHIVFGKQAPEICPVCSHAKAYFQRKAENY